jgi:hypothetical protein
MNSIFIKKALKQFFGIRGNSVLRRLAPHRYGRSPRDLGGPLGLQVHLQSQRVATGGGPTLCGEKRPNGQQPRAHRDTGARKATADDGQRRRCRPVTGDSFAEQQKKKRGSRWQPRLPVTMR